ncbi:Outer envelope pore protein 16, chloroplastic [Zostera marina]|uniref:Outer envelope pore protein 16, chloroplastic n=1 Tax=Zostera marina TaxID=29655 RepID=A0A0K9PH60_ZOSMR|nr:Outer envelope pore protein 16, chloroplastic [Zostera marina]
MPWSTISGSWNSPRVDLVIDMGNPFLNRSVDGFLKIGVVGATRVAAEEIYHCIRKGHASKNQAQEALKNMCKEGAYWGSIAGVYVGMEYGVERIRGTRDWKNAMIGGAITGGLVSISTGKSKDAVFIDAITGAAIATAADFINQLT